MFFPCSPFLLFHFRLYFTQYPHNCFSFLTICASLPSFFRTSSSFYILLSASNIFYLRFSCFSYFPSLPQHTLTHNHFSFLTLSFLIHLYSAFYSGREWKVNLWVRKNNKWLCVKRDGEGRSGEDNRWEVMLYYEFKEALKYNHSQFGRLCAVWVMFDDHANLLLIPERVA